MPWVTNEDTGGVTWQNPPAPRGMMWQQYGEDGESRLVPFDDGQTPDDDMDYYLKRQRDPVNSLESALTEYLSMGDYPPSILARNVQMIKDAAPNVPADFDWTQAVKNMLAKQNSQFGGFSQKDLVDGQLVAKLFEQIPGGAEARENLQQLPSFQSAQAFGTRLQEESDNAGDSFLGGIARPFLDTASDINTMRKEGALNPILAALGAAYFPPTGLDSLASGAGSSGAISGFDIANPSTWGGGAQTGYGAATGATTAVGGLGAVADAAAGAAGATTGGLGSMGIDLTKIGSGALRGAATSALSGGDPLTGALTGGLSSGLNPIITKLPGLDAVTSKVATNAIVNLVTTGKINIEALATGAALGYIDPKIASALNGIVPTSLIPTVIGAANQLITTGEVDPTKLAVKAVTNTIGGEVDKVITNAISPIFKADASNDTTQVASGTGRSTDVPVVGETEGSFDEPSFTGGKFDLPKSTFENTNTENQIGVVAPTTFADLTKVEEDTGTVKDASLPESVVTDTSANIPKSVIDIANVTPIANNNLEVEEPKGALASMTDIVTPVAVSGEVATEQPTGGLNAVAQATQVTPETKTESFMGLTPKDITNPIVSTLGSLLENSLTKKKSQVTRATRPTGGLQMVKKSTPAPIKMDISKLIPIKKAGKTAPLKTLPNTAKLSRVNKISGLQPLVPR